MAAASLSAVPGHSRAAAMFSRRRCPAAFGARRRSAPRSRHRAAGRASFSQHGKYHAAFGRCHASGAGSCLQTYYYFIAGKKVCVLPRFRRDGTPPPGTPPEGPARPGASPAPGDDVPPVPFFAAPSMSSAPSVRRRGALLAILGVLRRGVHLLSSRRAAAILGAVLNRRGAFTSEMIVRHLLAHVLDKKRRRRGCPTSAVYDLSLTPCPSYFFESPFDFDFLAWRRATASGCVGVWSARMAAAWEA